MGPIEKQIHNKLQAAFEPILLEIVNDSYKHNGHGGVEEFKKAMGADYQGPIESHFNVKIVSPKFNGMGRLARQRAVFDIIATEMKMVHALSVKALGEGEG